MVICGNYVDDLVLSDPNRVYVLTCQTFIQSPAELRISAGVTVYALPNSTEPNEVGLAPAIIIEKGATIHAQGTPSSPITFTAINQPAVYDAAVWTHGLWGGLVILGKAPTNRPADETVPGLAQKYYGGTDPADSSGRLEYVRVWHGGGLLSGTPYTRQFNGLTLGGVGHGTVIQYVEAAFIGADGFSFLGGTVDVKFVASLFNSDDAISVDHGYQGKGQFLFAMAGTYGGRLLYLNSAHNASTLSAQPRTHPRFASFTFFGGGLAASSLQSTSRHNMLEVDGGAGGTFANGILAWSDRNDIVFHGCENITYTQTVSSVSPDEVDQFFFSPHNILYGGGLEFVVGGDCSAYTSQNQAAWTDADVMSHGLRNAPWTALDYTDLTNTFDPRPALGSQGTTSSPCRDVDYAEDFDPAFFEAVTCKGAFKSPYLYDNWLREWSWLACSGRMRQASCAGIPDAPFAPLQNQQTEVLSGTVYWKQLRSDTTYFLHRTLVVGAGGSLNIDTDATILALPAPSEWEIPMIVIDRYAKIFAIGTATMPITFTSVFAEWALPQLGMVGQWGGLVLLGNAPTNYAIAPTVRGLSGYTFGGFDPADDSGTMRYVRVWHGGAGATVSTSPAGITFAGVGSATNIESCEVAYAAADGFSFLGGTLNVKYLAALFAFEAGFAIDRGYQGKGQFLFAMTGQDGEHAIKGSSGENGVRNLLPRSHPTWWGVTIIAGGSAAAQSNPSIRFEHGMGGHFGNVILANLESTHAGIRFTRCGSETVYQHTLPGPDVDINSYIYFSSLTIAHEPQGDDAFKFHAISGCVSPDPPALGVNADPGFAGYPFSEGTTAPLDPRPLCGPAYGPIDPAASYLDATFFVTTNYSGAFGATNWLDGWSYINLPAQRGFVSAAITCDCFDSCWADSDGVCDDGGEGSEYNSCALGTDCTDCGSRLRHPMPSPPPPPPLDFDVWAVVTQHATCDIDHGCVSDGEGDYPASGECRVRALHSVTTEALEFDLAANDYLRVVEADGNVRIYDPDIDEQLSAGSELWFYLTNQNAVRTHSGFRICVTNALPPNSAPPNPPPKPPPPLPPPPPAVTIDVATDDDGGAAVLDATLASLRNTSAGNATAGAPVVLSLGSRVFSISSFTFDSTIMASEVWLVGEQGGELRAAELTEDDAAAANATNATNASVPEEEGARRHRRLSEVDGSIDESLLFTVEAGAPTVFVAGLRLLGRIAARGSKLHIHNSTLDGSALGVQPAPMAALDVSGSAEVHVNGSAIVDYRFGAVSVSHAGNLSVAHSFIARNGWAAEATWGALYMHDPESRVAVVDTEIYANGRYAASCESGTCVKGGGLRLKSGTTRLSSNTLLKSNAAYEGAAIYIENAFRGLASEPNISYTLPTPLGHYVIITNEGEVATQDEIMPLVDEDFPFRCGIGKYGNLSLSTLTPYTESRIAQSSPRCAGVCPAGHFCSAATVDPVVCAAGTYCEEGLTGSGPVSCPMGTYGNGNGLTLEADCTACPPGYECASAGLAAPTQCALGFYEPNTSSTECAACPAGSYQDSTGATACMACPAGSYCTLGSAAPRPCPARFWGDREGYGHVSLCPICPAGFFCDAGTTAPEECPADTASASEGLAASADCTSCVVPTASVSGSTTCDICIQGYYLDPFANCSAAAELDVCAPCLSCLSQAGDPLTSCPRDTTLATVLLERGRWRYSAQSQTVTRCATGITTGETSCVGGSDAGLDGKGYCLSNHSGFLCQLCDLEEHYWSTYSGLCEECPIVPDLIGLMIAILCAVAAVVALLLWIMWHPPPMLRGLSQSMQRAYVKARHFALVPKAKVLIAMYQCVTLIPTVYAVELPNEYYDWMRIFNWIDFDFDALFVPGACLPGGFGARLLLRGIVPLAITAVLMPLVATFTVLQQRFRGRVVPWQQGFRSFQPILLFILFCFCASISYGLFSAWDCVEVVTGPNSVKRFLRVDLAVECTESFGMETDGPDPYRDIIIIAIVFVLIWPIGVPLLFLFSLLPERNAILEKRETAGTRATAFLHREYETPFFWWESLYLFERLVVVGFLQWIPPTYGLVRLQCGLLTTLAYTVVLSYLKPFKRDDLDVLALGAQIAILGFFFGALNIRLHSDLVLAYPDDSSLARSITGFASDFELSLVIFGLNLAVFVLFLALTSYQVFTAQATTTLLLIGSNRPPELKLTQGMRFHVFLSHVWSSGQDQTAVIKRQLQLLLPGIRAFLDVDDLEEIGRLEEYVEESECVMMLLSKAYFLSTNCLREVDATIDQKKPIVPVHEGDVSRGGMPLDVLRDDCEAKERREAAIKIFDDGAIIRWHRVHEFQLQSLKMIAEQILAKLPGFHDLGKELLGKEAMLFMPGEISRKVLAFDVPVVLYASPHNPGAAEFAAELLDKFGPNAGERKGKGKQTLGERSSSCKTSRFSTVAKYARAARARYSVRVKRGGEGGGEGEQQAVESPALAYQEAPSLDAHAPASPPASPPASALASPPASPPASPREEGSSPGRAESSQYHLPAEGLSSASTKAGLSITYQDPERHRSPSRRRIGDSYRSPTRRGFGYKDEAAATHMLIYLCHDTFVGENRAALQREVTWAQRSGMPILMVHENDPERNGCSFDRFFQTTPQALIDAGLYRKIAVALHPGSHRQISLAMAAKELGAVDPLRRGWLSGRVSGRLLGSQSGKLTSSKPPTAPGSLVSSAAPSDLSASRVSSAPVAAFAKRLSARISARISVGRRSGAAAAEGYPAATAEEPPVDPGAISSTSTASPRLSSTPVPAAISEAETVEQV